MTIQFGGHRLRRMLRILRTTAPEWNHDIALGSTDEELMRLGRRNERLEFDLRRWSVLALLYGGERRV